VPALRIEQAAEVLAVQHGKNIVSQGGGGERFLSYFRDDKEETRRSMSRPRPGKTAFGSKRKNGGKGKTPAVGGERLRLAIGVRVSRPRKRRIGLGKRMNACPKRR